MRVYVLDTEKTKAPGKVGEDGKYVYGTKNAGSYPSWDGTQEELDERFGGSNSGNGGTSEWGETVEPCVESATERAVFFQTTQDFGTSASVYMWIKGTETNLLGAWPGQRATHLGGGTFKFVLPDDLTGDESQWMIIWNNNNNGKQTADLNFTMRGLYTMNGYQRRVTTICGGGDTGEEPNVQPNPQPKEMCLNSADERVVFFEKSSDFGSNINCYIWFTDGSTTQICGNWPGQAATRLYDNVYRYEIPASAPAINNNWMIIWNDGSGNQTADLKYTNQGLYMGNNKGSIQCSSQVTAICDESTAVERDTVHQPMPRKMIINGRLYLLMPDGSRYDVQGNSLQIVQQFMEFSLSIIASSPKFYNTYL